MTEPVRRALLSVSDKTGLIPFARKLVSLGIELISTGGTAKALEAEGLPVTEVSKVTGFPEIMDGRVKTLHPAIHGGLLGIRSSAEHRAAMAKHGINPIGLLVVNLYPFEATVAKGAERDEIIENIDIKKCNNPTFSSDGSNTLAIALCGASAGQPVVVATSDTGGITIGGTTTVGTIYCVSATAGGICPWADLASTNYVTILGVGQTGNKIVTISGGATGIAHA